MNWIPVILELLAKAFAIINNAQLSDAQKQAKLNAAVDALHVVPPPS